jgi:outer membrane PBP1 activator LpoA protein
VLAEEWLLAAELLFQRAKREQSSSRGIGSRRDTSSSAESDRLFGYLLRVDLGTLRQQRASSSDPEWQSWLEMLIAYRSGQQSFATWRTSAGLESARLPMPAHLMEWSDAREIERVALLLPLDGNLATAGEAVVAGAMDQLYRLYPDPSDRPSLSTVDVSQYADIRVAYEDAANTGANVIIGPLTKASVANLQQLRSRRIPVIALNQPDTPRTARPRNWMSLSLAPEDESRQIADIAFGKGCRNAMVMGQDSIRGRRLLGAFEDRWLAWGGQLRGTLLVDDPAETNAALGKLLGSGSSDQRIRAIENAFDLPVDARGRGRSDFGCIFMLAPDAATARTWRPLLVFHMTGSVPVYATSAINDGLDNTRNRDLNGVLFVETPAMLPPNTADRLGRLRALGGDALTLAQHWNQISATEHWVVQGQTGLLRRNTDGTIERALDLATFDRAHVRREPLP